MASVKRVDAMRNAAADGPSKMYASKAHGEFCTRLSVVTGRLYPT